MFNIIWEFIINLLESFLFAVICNAKFTKRQYHYHTAEQTLFILCKSLLITLMNISKISTIISLTSVLLLNIIFLILFFVNPIFNSFFVSFIYCLILIISDALTLLIPIKFYNINLSQVLYLGNMRILFSLIYISIIALFVIIFLLFTPQVFVLGKLDKISYFIISTICVILEENPRSSGRNAGKSSQRIFLWYQDRKRRKSHELQSHLRHHGTGCKTGRRSYPDLRWSRWRCCIRSNQQFHERELVILQSHAEWKKKVRIMLAWMSAFFWNSIWREATSKWSVSGIEMGLWRITI